MLSLYGVGYATPADFSPLPVLWSSDETDEDWPSGFVFAPVGVELQDSTRSRLDAQERKNAPWTQR
jgi:hypothetical protein